MCNAQQIASFKATLDALELRLFEAEQRGDPPPLAAEEVTEWNTLIQALLFLGGIQDDNNNGYANLQTDSGTLAAGCGIQ